MSYAAIAMDAFLLFIFMYLLYTILLQYSKQRKRPPGPLALPIIGNLHMLGTLPHRKLHSLSKKYGPIMSLQLGQVPTIVVSSTEFAELFLKTHDFIFASRPKTQVAQLLSYGSKGLAFSEYGPYMRNLKKLCTLHLLSTSKVEHFAPIRREQLGLLVKSLKKAATVGHVDTRHRKEDFVDILLSMIHQTIDLQGKQNNGIDRTNIKAILLDMIMAGVDSITAAIEWAMSELLRHPRVMTKLQDEIENEVGIMRMVEETDLMKLSYLNMVVDETLRLYPVGPLLIPRESRESITIDGYHIKKKTRVIINAWAIGRDPNVWSDNAEIFYPERFINKKINYHGQDFKSIPFGSGRRRCPGIQMGLITVRLLVAQLVHCFNWELPSNVSPANLNTQEKFGLSMPRAEQLRAIPAYRLASDA